MGIDAYPVFVEADVSNGLPSFSMVGLLSSEVREARERVRTAIKNSGFSIPPKRITINLSPADIRKEGTRFDVAIAVAILASLGIVSGKNIEKCMFLGELGLGGTVHPVNGALVIAITAGRSGIKKLYLPMENVKEAQLIEEIEVIGISSLEELITLLNNQNSKECIGRMKLPEMCQEEEKDEKTLDYAQVNGQEAAIRATEVAVAGMHNIIYIGSPGCGKSMIARRIPSIFPGMSYEEIIEVTKIYSTQGLLIPECIMTRNPFRSPHHTITPQAMAGGGKYPKPGEITLSHRGVLFLDELPEFQRKTIEVLRQPLQEHKIIINRENASYEFPADFMFVAAMNSCKCGFYPDRSKCNCGEHEVKKYLTKIKGPLLDRIDICIQMSEVKIEQMQHNYNSEDSKTIRKRVEKVREIQRERFGHSDIRFNSRISSFDMEEYCRLGEQQKKILAASCEKFRMSARVYHKIIRIARTIADMEEENDIDRRHLMEALAYRNNLLDL